MDACKKHDNPNPKLSANPASKLFFWWLKPLFLYGKHHDLEVNDIYNTLPNDVSQLLGDKLERNWLEEVQIAEASQRKPRFYTALRKTFMWSFAYYGGWQLFVSIVLRVLQPYVLGFFIWHFNPESTSTTTDAYIYSSTLVLLATLTAFINHHGFLGLMEVGMRTRIASSSLVYRKILRLSKSHTATTPGQIINLLSNDVSKFEQLFILLHYIWILPIQGALITFMIYQSVGIASLAGIILISIQTIPVHGYIGKLTLKLRSRIAVRTDERMRLMTEIIGGIQVIKMYTWEKPFEKLVELSRSYEVDALTLISYLRGFTLATVVFTERTTLYFTVMAYVLLGNIISADKVFSMAQYFNILQLTMAILYPLAVAFIAEAAVSIKRLEDFLLLEETTLPIRPRQIVDKSAVTINNVNACWTEHAITDTLHDINIRIEGGKLYAVIGSVGGGKSSFLQLILRELCPSKGLVQIHGKIAYSSQEPWLFSGTIRNNILFGQSYDKEKYDEVVRVCALVKDFQQLNHGDKTLVGHRGTTLSGGQRARINLARAVYREADIYLLDDPLSAVDPHVGKHLFDECIKGHLRDKTRILVTHQVQYLMNCDWIILLKNGKVEYEGTYTDLQSKQLNLLNMLENEEERDDLSLTVVQSDEDHMTDIPLRTNNAKEEDQKEPKETEELMGKGTISKALYWRYFRAGGSMFIISCFLISLITGQLGSSGSDYWIAYWTKQEELRLLSSNNLAFEIGKGNSGPSSNKTFSKSWVGAGEVDANTTVLQNNGSFQEVPEAFYKEYSEQYYLDVDTALAIYGVLIVVSVVMTTARNLIFYKICMNASKNLHNLMFSSILKAPMLFFNTYPAGRILNRFSKDVGAVDEILPRTMVESIQIFAVMIGILAQVLIINWWSVFPMFIMGYLFWQIRNIYLSTAQDMKRLEGITKSPVFSHVTSSLLGLTTIRSANVQAMVSKEFDVHQDLHTGAYYLTIATGTAFGLALDIVSIGFIAFITYSFIIFGDGNEFAGNVGLAVSQVLILCGMLQHGMRQTAESMAQMTSVERILQFTELEKEGPFESEPNMKPPVNWPSRGEIKFDHLYVRYKETEPPVLKNLCFHIKPGEKIGIVGRTGAGKTSLISALFHLSILEGSIYIDDIDIKKIGLTDLRKKISIIPQESVLFSGTLRNNLDPVNKFDDATLWSALQDVELKSSIDSLDLRVDEGGMNFSAGERQLLCLARAIVTKNKILLLDEATANVDPKTDALIQETIRQKFNYCTVLTIAHRLKTIIDNDKVLVIDHGEAIEFDHPHVLLQNEKGAFASMIRGTGKAMSDQLKKISKETYEQAFGS